MGNKETRDKVGQPGSELNRFWQKSSILAKAGIPVTAILIFASTSCCMPPVGAQEAKPSSTDYPYQITLESTVTKGESIPTLVPTATAEAQISPPQTGNLLTKTDQKAEGLINVENMQTENIRSAEQKEVKRPFENKVGWAYTAVPGTSQETMAQDMRRMKELGANIVYLGHNNPGNVDPNGTEPGLVYAVYFALKNNTPSRADAEQIQGAIINALEAAKLTGLEVVLPVGYQIQMGLEWNRQNPEDLRRNPDGTFMSHWGSGETASPYSAKYRQDISEYYQWVNENIIKKYDNIIALNLADEPMGSDFSNWAKAAFKGRYGLDFETAPAQLRGEFLSEVIADYAAWSANTWKEINPDIWTMMTFHIQREAPFFPNIEKIFAQTPETFIFSADTHLHDAPSDQPLTSEERNLLYGLVRTLGFMSRIYEKPLMLWSSANAWGLAGQSVNRGGIEEALNNLDIVETAKQNGGKLGMIMAWGWNIKGQGVYRCEGNFDYVDKDEIIHQVAKDLLARRDKLSIPSTGKPERVIYLPSQSLYESIGRDNISHLAYNLGVALKGVDFVSQNTIYLTDGPALEEARRLGAEIIPLSPGVPGY